MYPGSRSRYAVAVRLLGATIRCLTVVYLLATGCGPSSQSATPIQVRPFIERYENRGAAVFTENLGQRFAVDGQLKELRTASTAYPVSDWSPPEIDPGFSGFVGHVRVVYRTELILATQGDAQLMCLFNGIRPALHDRWRTGQLRVGQRLVLSGLAVNLDDQTLVFSGCQLESQ